MRHPRLLFPGVVVLAVFHAIGLWNDFYHTLPHFDSAMHLFGGVMAALLFVFILGVAGQKRGFSLPAPARMRWLMIGFVFVLSVAWELFEVIAGIQPNLVSSVSDTMTDQAWGMVGAVLAVMLVRKSS